MVMTKNFGLAIIVGIVALAIFAYFIFGLNQKPADTFSHASSTKQVPPIEQTGTETQGLKIEDITVGTGREVKSGDVVTIHYLGTLPDGTKFDSSYDRNEPYETQIGVGTVIKGWDLGVVGMKVGGKRKLTIPPALGYGESGSGQIPPNATLIFELELVGIK